jgi:hypothetical protein
MESTTTKFAESTTTKFAAAETTIMECHATTAEATAAKAAATETATTKAAAMASAHATTAVAAAATPASQRDRWRSQANRRHCQESDNRLPQHNHPPSETIAPYSTRIAGGGRCRETLLASTSLLLNSAGATPD